MAKRGKLEQLRRQIAAAEREVGESEGRLAAARGLAGRAGGKAGAFRGDLEAARARAEVEERELERAHRRLDEVRGRGRELEEAAARSAAADEERARADARRSEEREARRQEIWKRQEERKRARAQTKEERRRERRLELERRQAGRAEAEKRRARQRRQLDHGQAVEERRTERRLALACTSLRPLGSPLAAVVAAGALLLLALPFVLRWKALLPWVAWIVPFGSPTLALLSFRVALQAGRAALSRERAWLGGLPFPVEGYFTLLGERGLARHLLVTVTFAGKPDRLVVRDVLGTEDRQRARWDRERLLLSLDTGHDFGQNARWRVPLRALLEELGAVHGRQSINSVQISWK